MVDGFLVKMDFPELAEDINAIQVVDDYVEVEYKGTKVNEFPEDLAFLDGILARFNIEKDLIDGRQVDPLYGYSGKERKDKEKEVDKEKAFDKFVDDIKAPVLCQVVEGAFQFPGTKEMALEVLVAREVALLSASPDVTLVDHYGDAHVFSVSSANRIFALVGAAYRKSLTEYKLKEKEIKNRIS